MKRTLLGLTYAAALIGLAAYSNSSSEAAKSYALLSVTSAVEGEEVTFKGMYFSTVRNGPAESVSARQTPFQVKVEAEEFVALFRKIDGMADLEVSLSLVEGAKTLRGGAGATCEAVCMVMRHSEGVASATL